LKWAIFSNYGDVAYDIVTVWAYYARYLLNEHSIPDGSDASQYLGRERVKVGHS